MRNAWHFTKDTLRDGRPLPPDGEWLEHEGELVMCKSGLHASERITDALEYAPGHTICRVRLAGTIRHDDDKMVATKRKILWRIDGEAVLRAFARWCALQVLDQWDAPEVVERYLRTGDPSIRVAARDAAWVAARVPAWDAARDAARDAAWVAARVAAGAAAWAAARDAAGAAAWVAAWVAAGDAAGAAAWAAARDAQEAQLIAMVEEAREGRTEWVLEQEAQDE